MRGENIIFINVQKEHTLKCHHIEVVDGVDLELDPEVAVDGIHLVEIHDRNRHVDLGVDLPDALGHLELLVFLVLVTQTIAKLKHETA